MKTSIERLIILVVVLVSLSLQAQAQYKLLLPNKFLLAEKDTLQVHFLAGNDLRNLTELDYIKANTSKLLLFGKGTILDLKEGTADSIVPLFSKRVSSNGLFLVSLETKSSNSLQNKADFINQQKRNGGEDIIKRVMVLNQPELREINTSYLKTLVNIGQSTGNYYSNKLGQTLEIILLDNPYKMNYGDDIAAQIYFHEKPLTKTAVEVCNIGINGKTLTTTYISDDKGIFYFKLNRSGNWLIRKKYTIPSEGTQVDFESFWATYTFGFSSKTLD